jgi:cysteine desulfurase
VVEAMLPYFSGLYGNPSSLYLAGRQARNAVEAARETIAAGLGARPGEIVFTGSGSEADNLAIRGVMQANRKRGRHLITSAVEHHAVLETCEALAEEGYEISVLPVDGDGRLDPHDLRLALREETVLVSVMHANNEIGTVQPVAELAAVAHSAGALFHTDAVQTAGHLPIDVALMGIDLLSLSAHKFYGPKGMGALYIRDGFALRPLVRGGGQESHRRAGTENVPGIVGTAMAFQLALETLEAEANRLCRLRDDLHARIAASGVAVRLNGHPTERLPNNLNLSFQHVEAEGVLLRLNQAGIYISMGSACTSTSIEPSHVIRAIGVPSEWERGTLRFSLGASNTEADIAETAAVLVRLIQEIQSSS